MAQTDLRQAADKFSEKVAEFYAEMLDAERTTRAACSCGRKFDVAVPDWNARANAMKVLLEYGYGRPAQQKDEQADLSSALLKDADELTPDERRLILAAARKRLGEADGEADGRAEKEDPGVEDGER